MVSFKLIIGKLKSQNVLYLIYLLSSVNGYFHYDQNDGFRLQECYQEI